MESIEVSSVSEYLEKAILETGEYSEIWYRGQRKESYKLIPSIYREPFKVENEIKFFKEFKALSRPYSQKNTNNDWEFYFHMQHYGVPTRLLDWSLDPFVALAFALFGNFDDPKSKDTIAPNENAVIYLLNKSRLDQKALSDYAVEDLSTDKWRIDSLLQKDFDILNPSSANNIKQKPTKEICIPIEPPLINERIIAQKGKFTLFPSTKDVKDIENMLNYEDYLIQKIIIQKEKIPEMKTHLRKLGISKHTLFPSLESLSNVIKESIL